MKYLFALLTGIDDFKKCRMAGVLEREEHEPGLTRVYRRSTDRYKDPHPAEIWVPSNEVRPEDVVKEYPDNSGDKYENYRCVLVGVDPMQDRAAIERFYERHFRFSTEWVEVSKEVFDFLDNNWYSTVLDVCSDPNMDFGSEIRTELVGFELAPDERLLLGASRLEGIAFQAFQRKTKMALRARCEKNGVPEKIINHLLL